MNEIVDNETGELIPLGGDTTALESITRGEIDIQIATAHKFPRSIDGFKKLALRMVTQDDDVARESIYVLPARRGSNKAIEGPSVRFAEMIQSTWGNCRSGARIIHEGKDFIVAQGIFHDLETNSAVTFEVQRRIVDSKGRRYGVDMIGVTANAACSVALRNAILKGIPKAIWQSLYVAAKQTIIGEKETFNARTSNAIKAFAEIGIKKDALFHKLDISGKDDLEYGHLVLLGGMLTALQDGELSVRDFIIETPAPSPTAPGPTTAASKKAKAEPKPKPTLAEELDDDVPDMKPVGKAVEEVAKKVGEKTDDLEIPASLDRKKKEKADNEKTKPASEAAPEPDEQEAAQEEGDEATPAPDEGHAAAPAPAPDAPAPESDGGRVVAVEDAGSGAEPEDAAINFDEVVEGYENEMSATTTYEDLDEVMDRLREVVFPNIPEPAHKAFLDLYKENRTRIRREG